MFAWKFGETNEFIVTVIVHGILLFYNILTIDSEYICLFATQHHRTKGDWFKYMRLYLGKESWYSFYYQVYM